MLQLPFAWDVEEQPSADPSSRYITASTPEYPEIHALVVAQLLKDGSMSFPAHTVTWDAYADASLWTALMTPAQVCPPPVLTS